MFLTSPLSSHNVFVFAPLSRRLYDITGPIVFTLSAVCYAAALFSDSHGRCFCVFICVLVYVECVLSQAHQDDLEERFFFCLSNSSVSQLHSQYTAVQQRRYNRSRAPRCRLYAGSHGLCVWLAHSSRRSNHDNSTWYMINTSYCSRTSYQVYETCGSC